MKIHLLSGFLGSGKTTAMLTAAGLLIKEGIRAAVITNDQGIRLVDGGFLAALGIPGREVVNGCFCCNYSDLGTQIDSLRDSDRPDVIFAESVGSCTDIVATVLRPLRTFRPDAGITLSVVCDCLLLKMLLIDNRPLFNPDVDYIFRKQIEEAGLLLLNKTDLVTGPELEEIRRRLETWFPGREMISLRATDPASVSSWMETLNAGPGFEPVPPTLDYERYASGEAMMGWLDEEIYVRTEDFSAPEVAGEIVREVSRSIRDAGYPVGHVKWLLNGKTKLSRTAVSADPVFPALSAAAESRLLLNARVQVHPETLRALVDAAVKSAREGHSARITITDQAAFQPGYPRPEYRMV